jgi:hypothetical protein
VWSLDHPEKEARPICGLGGGEGKELTQSGPWTFLRKRLLLHFICSLLLLGVGDGTNSVWALDPDVKVTAKPNMNYSHTLHNHTRGGGPLQSAVLYAYEDLLTCLQWLYSGGGCRIWPLQWPTCCHG